MGGFKTLQMLVCARENVAEQRWTFVAMCLVRKITLKRICELGTKCFTLLRSGVELVLRSDIECDLIENPFLHERRHKGLGLGVLDTRLEAVQQRFVHLERFGAIGAVALEDK